MSRSRITVNEIQSVRLQVLSLRSRYNCHARCSNDSSKETISTSDCCRKRVMSRTACILNGGGLSALAVSSKTASVVITDPLRESTRDWAIAWCWSRRTTSAIQNAVSAKTALGVWINAWAFRKDNGRVGSISRGAHLERPLQVLSAKPTDAREFQRRQLAPGLLQAE